MCGEEGVGVVESGLGPAARCEPVGGRRVGAVSTSCCYSCRQTHRPGLIHWTGVSCSFLLPAALRCGAAAGDGRQARRHAEGGGRQSTTTTTRPSTSSQQQEEEQ